MNIGHFGITGFTSPSFQQIDATTSYSRCLRWLARFNSAIICLALFFVFFGAVGSMAQEVKFKVPESHDGATPFEVTVEMTLVQRARNEEDARNRASAYLIDADGTVYNNAQKGPDVSGGELDSTRQRYTYTVTPRAPEPIKARFGSFLNRWARDCRITSEELMRYGRSVSIGVDTCRTFKHY